MVAGIIQSTELSLPHGASLPVAIDNRGAASLESEMSTITQPCLVCGIPLRIFPSRAKKTVLRCCSRKCKGIYDSQSKTGKALRDWREVLHAKTDRRAANECWPWLGRKAASGYGVLDQNGKSKRAHRLAWELINGEVPPNMEVCHRCDHPWCVNPAHLWIGTHKDNMADASHKGRSSSMPGESNPSARLTEKEVAEIRAIYRPNVVTQAALGRKYGVSESAIWLIIHNQSWPTVKEQLRAEAEHLGLSVQFKDE